MALATCPEYAGNQYQHWNMKTSMSSIHSTAYSPEFHRDIAVSRYSNQGVHRTPDNSSNINFSNVYGSQAAPKSIGRRSSQPMLKSHWSNMQPQKSEHELHYKKNPVHTVCSRQSFVEYSCIEEMKNYEDRITATLRRLVRHKDDPRCIPIFAWGRMTMTVKNSSGVTLELWKPKRYEIVAVFAAIYQKECLALSTSTQGYSLPKDYRFVFERNINTVYGQEDFNGTCIFPIKANHNNFRELQMAIDEHWGVYKRLLCPAVRSLKSLKACACTSHIHAGEIAKPASISGTLSASFKQSSMSNNQTSKPDEQKITFVHMDFPIPKPHANVSATARPEFDLRYIKRDNNVECYNNPNHAFNHNNSMSMDSFSNETQDYNFFPSERDDSTLSPALTVVSSSTYSSVSLVSDGTVIGKANHDVEASRRASFPEMQVDGHMYPAYTDKQKHAPCMGALQSKSFDELTRSNLISELEKTPQNGSISLTPWRPWDL